MRTKIAKIIISSIRLQCPECQSYIRYQGRQTIYMDAAIVWDNLAKQTLNCSECNAPFRLPACPFPIE